MLEPFLIALAVSADAFAAALTYGIKKVQINFTAKLLIALIGAVFLGAALFASAPIRELISASLCAQLSAAMLILVAMKNLSDSYGSEERDLPENVMTLKSAAALAAALSADSLAVGFSAGVTMSIREKLTTTVLCFIFGLISVTLGRAAGGRLFRGLSPYRTAMLSAGVLFVLSIIKLRSVG